MGYCILSIDKFNSVSQMRSALHHNLREIPVDNVDPTLSHLNEEMVPLEKPIEQLIQEKKEYRNTKTNRKLRSDAVIGIEILLGYSKGSKLDIEKWKEENLKWLREKFDISPDGKSNLLSVTFHMDETNPHIHSVIVPMDGKGLIRCKEFINGPADMRNMQTEYADRMKQFGLQRGLDNSVAKKVDIRRLYTDLNQAMNNAEQSLEIRPGDTLEKYHDKAVEACKDISGSYERKITEKNREIIELKTHLKNYEKTHSMDEVVQANVTKKEAEKEKEKFQGILREYKTIDNVNSKLQAAKKLNDAIVNCDDKELQQNFMEQMKLIMQKEEERKKREKHLERERLAREKLEK